MTRRTPTRLRAMRLLPLLFASLAAAPASAEEGMWLPEQIDEVADRVRGAGWSLPIETLKDPRQHPLSAVVSLGGCSASFVSPDGLIVTNHHCVIGALGVNSTPEVNLLEDGFLARSRDEERWSGPGSRVFVTESLEDVTERVLTAADAAEGDRARFDQIDLAKKELVAECEATPGFRCNVAEYDGGASFRLIRQLEIRDVRLVYAPSDSIGAYGGEIDNWMWPRHSGDFAFLRAWVGPDGAPADHAADNVPYRPKDWLRVSTQGVDEGDFVMVAGYPGTTQRHRIARGIRFARDMDYPWTVRTLRDLIGIFRSVGDTDPEAAVRLQPRIGGFENYLKNTEGMLDNFRSPSDPIGRVEARETKLLEWARGSDRVEAQQGLESFAEMDTLLAERHRTFERDAILRWTLWGAEGLRAAGTLHWLAVERGKPDLERDAGYQERDWGRIRESMERFERTAVREADVRVLAYFFRQADGLSADTRIAFVDDLLARHRKARGDVYEAAARSVVDSSKIYDRAERLRLLEADVATFEASKDPLVAFAVSLHDLRRTINEQNRTDAGVWYRTRPRYMAMVRAGATSPVYPDANGTLRITFGLVRGYPARDGVYHVPFTTLRGIPEKDTGEDPFDAPKDLLEAIEVGRYGPWTDPASGSVVVNFLSTLDITGGNSGSATLNHRGELVGLAFDGNWEAMASDWMFDPVRTRSIHVDARYMLWVMDRIDGAWDLIREMGLTPAFEPTKP